MVVLAKEELEQISLPVIQKPVPSSLVPVIDLSNPNSKSLIIAAAQELGFFKVINHGVPMELMSSLESEAMEFFALPQLAKEIHGLSPFGYGSKRIGSNGDLGWVEYLLLEIASKPKSQSSRFW
jgi:gibberellin 2beta-dioxygenase